MLLRRKVSYKINHSIWFAKIIVAVIIFVNKQDTCTKIYDYNDNLTHDANFIVLCFYFACLRLILLSLFIAILD